MDPHSVEAMSKERKFDFEAIQKQVNMNVFSFVLVNARKMIKEAGKTVRGSYLATAMRRYATHLEESFNSVLKMDSNENVPSDQTDGLRKFVSKTNFAAMFYTIFGRSDNSEFEPVTVYQCFDVFHKYFNYLWLGMPIMLFPKATKALQVLCKQPKSDEILAREDLSDYIRYSTEFMKSHGQSEQDIMGHNLVYLHVNYNTFRLSFWCMYFLLADQKAYERFTMKSWLPSTRKETCEMKMRLGQLYSTTRRSKNYQFWIALSKKPLECVAACSWYVT